MNRQAPESIAELFDAAAQMAAERLREVLGAAQFEALAADPEASVRVGFDLQRRHVAISVKWPARYGDQLQLPVIFRVPTQAANA